MSRVSLQKTTLNISWKRKTEKCRLTCCDLLCCVPQWLGGGGGGGCFLLDCLRCCHNFLSLRHWDRLILGDFFNLHFLLLLFDIISGYVIELLVLVNLVSYSLLVLLAPALDAGAGVGGDDDRSSHVWLPLKWRRGTFGRLVAFHRATNFSRRRSVENSVASRENSSLKLEIDIFNLLLELKSWARKNSLIS